ncbi:MAG: hypothetical protein IIC08_04805 [Proteobacteria bacterium]|nr:hypothetical protein [Pseudomonadota bacterium]
MVNGFEMKANAIETTSSVNHQGMSKPKISVERAGWHTSIDRTGESAPNGAVLVPDAASATARRFRTRSPNGSTP